MGNGDEFDDMFEEKEDFSIEIDFGTVEALEALAPGGYRARVASIEKKLSKASGEPNLVWTFELLEPYAKRKLFANTSLQPQALWKLQGWLRMLGIETEGKLKVSPKLLVGRKCILLVSVESYQGTKRNRVDDLLPYSEEGAGEEAKSSSDLIVGDILF